MSLHAPRRTCPARADRVCAVGPPPWPQRRSSAVSSWSESPRRQPTPTSIRPNRRSRSPARPHRHRPSRVRPRCRRPRRAPSPPTTAATATSAETIPLARTLGDGVTGQDVRRVQQRLTDLGFDPGGVDGVFGPLTIQAVWAYEKLVEGTPRERVTGQVSPERWNGDAACHCGDAATAAAGWCEPHRDLPAGTGHRRLPRRPPGVHRTHVARHRTRSGARR